MLLDQALANLKRRTGLDAPNTLMQRLALEHLGFDYPKKRPPKPTKP